MNYGVNEPYIWNQYFVTSSKKLAATSASLTDDQKRKLVKHETFVDAWGPFYVFVYRWAWLQMLCLKLGWYIYIKQSVLG